LAVPRAAIVDTGPLVAFLDRGERHHAWTIEQVRSLDPPLLVCEPVLAEAMFLLARQPKAQDALFGLVVNGAVRIAFQVGEHLAALRTLHRKYRDQPISLADACVVRMAELFEKHLVFTLDSDFLVYRKNGREPLDLIFPTRS
jgi:predicted nucleic acid-binding protein